MSLPVVKLAMLRVMVKELAGVPIVYARGGSSTLWAYTVVYVNDFNRTRYGNQVGERGPALRFKRLKEIMHVPNAGQRKRFADRANFDGVLYRDYRGKGGYTAFDPMEDAEVIDFIARKYKDLCDNVVREHDPLKTAILAASANEGTTNATTTEETQTHAKATKQRRARRETSDAQTSSESA